MNKNIEQIRERITQGLKIARISKNTLKRFKEIANDDDFCSDYGNTLKYLIDFHDGIIIHGNEQILQEIENLNNELNLIKKEVYKEKEKKPVRKMMNGKEIGE